MFEELVTYASTVPPEDRLPTFAEVDGFDADAAWDRLSPTEQRRVGILAVRLGVIGQRLNFEHNDWTHEQVRMMEVRESKELEAFNDAVEPLWQTLFGWVCPSWSKPVIKQVA
ncbi:hypothetical protein [Tardiphaga sp.]|uniref:hypothetical protein n=1 Tax=Tardiphaga sp. TaxID=1926292 RepID=UPI0026224EFC|nr:hypothetical protein [Tardiphaga sp.]MDB5619502.1 hypothetical protein [Tardiphaga sp.]